MERIPNTPNTLIQTLHRPGDLCEFLAARAAQQQGFVEDFRRLEVAHADGFFFAVDVFAFQDGVLARARGDGDFDLGVGGCEGLEVGFEEGAEWVVR